jgi:chromosome segregation ATPase
MEYEGTIRQFERELRDKTMEITRQGEEMRSVIKENEELAQRLEVQQREYLRLVEETRDNADILAMRSLGANGEGSPRGSFDEVKELRERIHLLTEENQALFEQVTLLRAHFDGFNRDCQIQIEDAAAKGASFDMLSGQVSKLIEERDRLLGEKLEAERRLSETLRIA